MLLKTIKFCFKNKQTVEWAITSGVLEVNHTGAVLNFQTTR